MASASTKSLELVCTVKNIYEHKLKGKKITALLFNHTALFVIIKHKFPLEKMYILGIRGICLNGFCPTHLVGKILLQFEVKHQVKLNLTRR